MNPRKLGYGLSGRALEAVIFSINSLFQFVSRLILINGRRELLKDHS